LLFGLLANWTVPLIFLVAAAQALRVLDATTETSSVLVGLALVAGMPIAGPSTSWAQNTDGNMTLSLGLVLLSTLLIPLVTPLALHGSRLALGPECQGAFDSLIASSAGLFLGLWVALPAIAGLLCRRAIPQSWIASALPVGKLISALVLLLLNYSNASLYLPQVFAQPDRGLLAVVTLTTVGLSIVTLWRRLFGRDAAESHARPDDLLDVWPRK
jgi:BASS family bile acid:Na+ symporter